jgi:DNA (cytosine-5)-methyltransferase 1
MGEEKGFDDSRGELFFEIVRVLRHHQPKAFLLENVANVVVHDEGNTLKVILHELRAAGYAPG